MRIFSKKITFFPKFKPHLECKWRHIHCFSPSCASAPPFALVFTPDPHYRKHDLWPAMVKPTTCHNSRNGHNSWVHIQVFTIAVNFIDNSRINWCWPQVTCGWYCCGSGGRSHLYWNPTIENPLKNYVFREFYFRVAMVFAKIKTPRKNVFGSISWAQSQIKQKSKINPLKWWTSKMEETKYLINKLWKVFYTDG
jgi:hypothetical protein